MWFFICFINFFFSSILPNIHEDDLIVYNDQKKEFEIKKDLTSLIDIENTWHNLKIYIDRNLSDTEKQNFYTTQGVIEDFKYLRHKKNILKNQSFNMLKQWSKKLQTPIYQIEGFDCENITLKIKQRLLIEANRSRTHAYAPYSKFHVGAAILTKSGKVYSGCNFENAAYGNTICAERSAIAKTVSEENRGISLQERQDIVAIAVVLRGGIGSPCGNCRQALYEFNPNMLVIMSDIDGENIIEKPLHELIPYGFGPISFANAKVE